MQVPESIAYITCITQVTPKFMNHTLLVNNRCFFLMHFYFSLDLVTDKNRLSHCVGLQAQVFQLLAGKVCRILVFEGQDYSDRWSLEATNDLTVELIRCCEYFSRENTALKRSHSSEKYDQRVDKHGQAWFSRLCRMPIWHW